MALDRDTQVELSLQPRVAGEITVTDGAAADRRQVHRGAGQLHQRGDRGPARPAHLQGALPARPRRGRERAPGAQRRRLADGQPLPARRHQRHQPRTTATSSRTSPSSTSRRSASSAAASPPSSAARAAWWSTPSPSRGPTISAARRASSTSRRASWPTTRSRPCRTPRTPTSWASALGGPILRDRLWFYGSASRPSITTTDRRNNLGSVPDEEAGHRGVLRQADRQPDREPVHQRRGSAPRDRTDKNASIGSTANPSVGQQRLADYLLGTATWTWNVTADSFVEAKYNHDKEENSTDPTLSPRLPAGLQRRCARTSIGLFTSTADFLVGGATAAGPDRGRRQPGGQQPGLHARRGAGAPSRPSRPGATRATTCAPASPTRRTRSGWSGCANGWGTVTWNATTRQFTASYVSQQPPHTGRGTSYGVFLQDQIALGERLTLTARRARQQGRLLRRGAGLDAGHQAEEEDPHRSAGTSRSSRASASPSSPAPRLGGQALLQLSAATTTPRTSRSAGPARRPASSPPARPSTPPAT